ncbi:MAG: thiamine-phosphate kinase [Microscillaceae bacterium]|nr:thiamine-phosphate kinase [Microscillaceae bacterium]
MQRTEIQQLGEFALIEKVTQGFKLQNKESILGVGDDAAVIDTGGEDYWLLSTDMLLEGVHFDLMYSSLKHLGYKAVAVNVSDIAAMNGIPKQITIGLALSNRFSVEAVEEIYTGIRAACENYQVDLVGGDTTSSRAGLVISVSVTGTVPKNRISYRGKAKHQEIVCVTGDLGAAFLGLQVLEQEKQVFLANPDMQPQLEGKDYIVGRQMRPEARTDIIHELRELDIVPTAMIDISDGLASEIFHICKHSESGAVLFEDKIPIDGKSYEQAIEFKIDPITCALNGGEDYELLFTVTHQDFEKIKYHHSISAIGYIIPKEDGIQLKTRGGNMVPIQAQGWKHF